MLAATSNEHVDELLQVERRDLGRVDWAHDPSAQFLDEQHRPVRSLDDYLNAAPSGWEWVRSSDNCFSTIDMERCCDNEGWTYGLESHLSAASAYFSDASVYADRDAVAAAAEAEAAGGIKAALEQVERERDWLSVINSPFERTEHTVRIRRVLLLRRRVDIQENRSLEACLVFSCALSVSAPLFPTRNIPLENMFYSTVQLCNMYSAMDGNMERAGTRASSTRLLVLATNAPNGGDSGADRFDRWTTIRSQLNIGRCCFMQI